MNASSKDGSGYRSPPSEAPPPSEYTPSMEGEAGERSTASSIYGDVDVEDDADFQSQYSVDNQDYLGEGDLLDDDDDGDDDDGDDDDNDAPEQEEGGGGGGGEMSSLRHPFRHSTGSLQGLNAFAPPFYNRPPTPLPPSPSLTSLLRPPFSATTSRPTTPDSSDVETTNDTEAAVAKSARQATTVPRASPKVPTYEYYGFVLYLASSLAFR